VSQPHARSLPIGPFARIKAIAAFGRPSDVIDVESAALRVA
jgi:hypothetical protein